MKKYILFFVVSTMLVLTSCGSESTTSTETTDSTAVSVDTTLSSEKDTIVEFNADSTTVK
jgi:ABC-type enterochelin transport system substrate-binding protein